MHMVFDIGGVLIDWNPTYLFSRLIPDPVRRTFFLENVCSPSWNAEQDKGRSWASAESEAIARHPEWADEIRAYRASWHDMVAGPVDGGFELLTDALASNYRVTALSNWNDETFDEVAARFPDLLRFDGATVSGKVGLIKPDPEVYALHERTFDLIPDQTVFIDDNVANIEVARGRGWNAIHHRSATHTRRELAALGIAL
ncbi:HAD family phosphatase [Nitratireductor sp. ZSWI3]|uniref:HAD family hydrolase n=1 Tax=Nitratireductor sp. ZSWI3 TaxID=2966359 RepID=UPI00214FE151|nr:HAD family phosphatase [Nitratireductor sp. ZSWI3]MCR4265814.1 HAD family phosphatase [Nitratireductor sp. ZSWI3]